MADEKTSDEKKSDEKKAAEKQAAEASAPRPDPVGERNYAMSEPVVRPEGVGTPGAMRHVAPPVLPVPPVKADEPKPDDVVKTTDTTARVAPVRPPSPPSTTKK